MDKKIDKKRWPIQKILIYAVIIGGAGALLSMIWKQQGVSRLNVDTERLLIDTLHRGAFQEFIPVSGVVQPYRSVLLDAIEGGRVEEKLVDDGIKVEAGQPILRLSNDDLQREYLNLEGQLLNQINQIRSLAIVKEQNSLALKNQLLDADYQLSQLKKQVARNKSLYEDKVISQVDWEIVEDNYQYQKNRKVMLELSIEKDQLSNNRDNHDLV